MAESLPTCGWQRPATVRWWGANKEGGMSASSVMVVFVTCPSVSVGRRLSRLVIQQRLAACVNLIPRVESTFRWKRKIEHCAETLLVIKTSQRRFAALRTILLRHHPYDVPEIIGWRLANGHAPYVKWVLSNSQ